jgi:protocatechuate 3,4-dioxygenase, alpha subunit
MTSSQTTPSQTAPSQTTPSQTTPSQTTPSQTIGPFFSHALTWPGGEYVVPQGTPGAYWIRGRMLDGAGEPVPDALIETWQAEGFGRCLTDAQGGWGVHTVAPAKFIAVSVFARGLLKRLVIRIPASVKEFDIVLQGENETTFYEF